MCGGAGAARILIEVVATAVSACFGRIPQEGLDRPLSRWAISRRSNLLWLSLSQGMPVGIAYGIWTACGVALVAVIRAIPVRRSADLGDGLRHRPHRRRRAHDRAGRRRALSAPASTITTAPSTGTESNPTRRLVASAMTPTSNGAPKKADPHQPGHHRQPRARAHAGQLIGPVHGGRYQRRDTQTRSREPRDRAGHNSEPPARRPCPRRRRILPSAPPARSPKRSTNRSPNSLPMNMNPTSAT